MATLNATMDGWRCRVSKTWYPTNGTWTAEGSEAGVNPSISSPTTSGTTSSGNKYTVILRVKTPNVANISGITIGFECYDRNTTQGYLYGSLRSTYTDSTASDTTSTYRTNAIGSEGSATNISGNALYPTTVEWTFNGTLAANTYYYLFLYTKSTNDIYGINVDYNGYSWVTYTPQYTVSYNNGGRGTAPSSHSVNAGSSLTLRSAMSNVAGTSYKVTYNANGGSSTPAAATSSYTYQHTKWAAGSASGTQYNPGTSYTPSASVTMYGVWSGSRAAVTLPAAISRNNSSASYTVSYNVNGGNSTAPSSQTVTRSTPYTFGGWNTNSSGTGTNYNASTSYTPSADVTLYAKWTPGTTTGSITLASAATKNNTTQSGYKVTFNANGGSCSTASLTATDTVKWTFSKWNTAADGSGTNYNAGATYSSSANATMYAQWTSTISVRGSITLPTPTRDGYNFKGWGTASSSTSGSTGSYTPSGNVTLYAVWELKTYAVTYNANGHGTAPSNQTKNHGTALTLQPFIAQNTSTGYTVSYNKNGGTSTPSSSTSTLTHTQTNWNTAANGSGSNYGSQASYTTNAALNLYAIWSTSNGAITLPAAIKRNAAVETGYTVTFDANGGSCTITELTSEKTRTYTFSKWAAGSTSGTKYNAGASFTPTGNTTMYATWSESVTNGSITLPTPTRTGYTFQGWATSNTASAGTAAGQPYTPTAATTLYAIWKINSWTISYNANGYGTAPSSQTKTYNVALTLQSFIAQ